MEAGLRSNVELRPTLESPGRPTFLRRSGEQLQLRNRGGELRALPLTGAGAATTLLTYAYRTGGGPNSPSRTYRGLFVLDARGAVLASFGRRVDQSWDSGEVRRFARQWSMRVDSADFRTSTEFERAYPADDASLVREGVAQVVPAVASTDRIPLLRLPCVLVLGCAGVLLTEFAAPPVGPRDGGAALAVNTVAAWIGCLLGVLLFEAIRTGSRRRAAGSSTTGLAEDHRALHALDKRGVYDLVLEDDTLVRLAGATRQVLREPGVRDGVTRIVPYRTPAARGLLLCLPGGRIATWADGEFAAQDVRLFAAAAGLDVDAEITDPAVLRQRLGKRYVELPSRDSERTLRRRVLLMLAITIVPYAPAAALLGAATGPLGGFVVVLVALGIAIVAGLVLLLTRRTSGR